jgi:tetratricopeptide (TPR) repeat protein
VQADEPTGAEQQVVDLVEAGRLAEANVAFDRIITRLPPDEDHVERAATMVHRAVAAWRLGRIPLALELAAEGWTSLDAAEAQGARAAQAIGMLGYLVEAIGRRAAAIELHRRAIRVARDSGDRAALAHCLQRLGAQLPRGRGGHAAGAVRGGARRTGRGAHPGRDTTRRPCAAAGTGPLTVRARRARPGRGARRRGTGRRAGRRLALG